jgi:hypothetical protein
MKKFTVLCLAGLLVLAFGATGYAQAPTLTWSGTGYFEIGTYWTMNVPAYGNMAGSGMYRVAPAAYSTFGGASTGYAPTSALDRKVAFWDQRTRLWITGAMGKELSGTVYFEIDGTWGGASNLTAITREANNVGAWNADKSAVEVAGAYLTFGIPYFGIPAPMTMQIGVQPLAIRPAILVYSDGAGITGGIKLDPVMIKPVYFKALEGAVQTADDVDIYGLEATAKLGTFSIGGYGLYYNMNSYPFQVSVPNATLALAGLSPQAQGTQRAKMWWLGVYADGKAGPVNLNFDAIYDYGRVLSKGNFDVPNVKYSGWVSRLKVDFPMDQFNIGVTGMYASGTDANRSSSSGQPGTLSASGALSDKVGSFVVPPGSEAGPINSESVVVYSMWAGSTGGAGLLESANYQALSRGPFGGSWFAKLYASVKATPSYKITLQGLYIGDTTKNGNTYGTAVIPGTAVLRDDKRIGVEADVISEWNIYKNLLFSAGVGYLWAGPAMDLRQGALLDNFSMKNPWAVRTDLKYFF